MDVITAGDWTGVVATAVAGLFGLLTIRAQTGSKHEDKAEEMERRYSLALAVVRAYQQLHPETVVPISKEVIDDLK